MKNNIFIFIMMYLFTLDISNAQMNNGLFGNEWINYSKTYYKFNISEDGIYRIPKNHLEQSGINLAELSINNIQIFNKGVEIPVFVKMTNGIVDFIEFYGEKNKGHFDSELYLNPVHHFNPEYSMITDTSAYFLTWGAGINGRRYSEHTSNLNNLPQKEEFYIHRSINTYNQIWSPGKTYSISGVMMSKSSYEYGEGWGGASTSFQTFNVNTPYLYPNAVSAKAEIRTYSVGNFHNLNFNISGQNLYTNIFNGDSVQTHNFNFNSNLIQSNTAVILTGAYGVSDKHSISYAAIEYPRYFNFENKSYFKFSIKASSQRKFLEINNFNNSGTNQGIYLFDLTNGIKIHCFFDQNTGNILTDLPASTVDRELVLINFNDINSFRTVGQLKHVNFTNYFAHDGEYVIIAHDRMFRDSEGNNPVLEYAAYRAAGGLRPVVVNVQELFDQFGYGINLHPQAIRNFSDFIQTHWQSPKFVFLLGKGKVYTEIRNANTYDILIPTFGSPPSDNLMFSRRQQNVPSLAVGRLSIVNGDELRCYMNKIIGMETIKKQSAMPKDRSWEKRVIHMGGGANQNELTNFSAILNVLKNNLESGKFGAEVYSFFKDNSNANDPGSGAQLDAIIEKGAAVMTYLGHATADGFDYNAFLIDKYNNQNKYPLFISLSCSNGNIFKSELEMSENLVLAPNKGVSAFIGFTEPVSLFSANIFCTEFYRLLSNEGNALTNAELSLQALTYLTGTGLINELAANYLVYHGDPAIKISGHEGFDFTIDKESIKTEPPFVDNFIEEFDLYFDLYNLGIVADTSVNVNLYRKFPLGDTVFVASQLVSNVKNYKQVKFTIKNGGAKAIGLNTFFIKIDELDEITEIPVAKGESNNNHICLVNITANNVFPIYPPDFAMLPNGNIKFVASASDVFADEQEYYFEIDTTLEFNSPLHTGAVAIGNAGAITFEPQINYLDSVVYFWRIYSTNNLPHELNNYYSTFIVMPGQEGWNQSHSAQFGKNRYSSLQQTQNESGFIYSSKNHTISVVNAFTPNVLAPGYVATFFNNTMTDKCRCQTENGIYVQVIDSNNNIWTNPGFSQRYGAVNCDAAGRTSNTFLFKTSLPAKQVALYNFIQDSIPEGSYVLLYTLNNAAINSWNQSLINLFQNFGSTKIQLLKNSSNAVPWAFFFKKGDIDGQFTKEAAAETASGIISLDAYISDSWHSGYMESAPISSSKGWDWLEWNQTYTQNNSNVALGTVSISGVDKDGVSVPLINNVFGVDTCIASIDVMNYASLKVKWINSDRISKVPPKLDYLRILAEPVGELTFRPDLFQVGYKDSVEQGTNYNFSVMIQNISSSNMDSVLIKYYILDNYNSPVYTRVKPLIAGDTLIIPMISIPTANLSGAHQLIVELNPEMDQMEMCYLNNNIIVPFYVKKELYLSTNPLEAKDKTIYNFPNPVKNFTKFSFNHEVLDNIIEESIFIEIVNVRGQIVKKIAYNELGLMNVGNNFITNSWNACDDNGQLLPIGIYFYYGIGKTTDGVIKKITNTSELQIIR
jgi:hypothetical protein